MARGPGGYMAGRYESDRQIAAGSFGFFLIHLRLDIARAEAVHIDLSGEPMFNCG